MKSELETKLKRNKFEIIKILTSKKKKTIS